MTSAAPTANDMPLLLFPGALGDLLCLLPTLQALLRRHPSGVRLVANSAWLPLVAHAPLQTVAQERREVAELYASGPFSDAALRLFSGIGDVYSWTAHGNEEFRSRLARLAGGNIRLFPFRGMRPGEHAADYYARCVGITPVSPGADLLCVDRQTVSATIAGSRLAQADWLLLHPGSGSPAKNWQGFEALVRYWRQVRQQPVALLLGPAEIERSATQPPGSHPLPLASQADVVIASASLPEVAAWLAAAPLYAGNDSGISHLAAPCGARGVVLFASSDPVAWAPRSPLLRVLHRPRACRLCGKDVFCIHRLPVDDVIAALDVMAAARPAGEG